MHTHVVHSVNLYVYIGYKIIPTTTVDGGIFFNIAIAHLLTQLYVHQHSICFICVDCVDNAFAECEEYIRSTMASSHSHMRPIATVSYSYIRTVHRSSLLDLHRKTDSLASRKQRVVAIGTRLKQSPFGFRTPLSLVVISSNVIYLVFVHFFCSQLLNLFSGATLI